MVWVCDHAQHDRAHLVAGVRAFRGLGIWAFSRHRAFERGVCLEMKCQGFDLVLILVVALSAESEYASLASLLVR